MLVLGLAAGCGNNSSTTSSQDTNEVTNSTSPVEAPATYLGGLNQAQQLAAKTADLTTVNEAIRMFKAENDRYPRSLQELVQQKYLPRLPQAPYGTRLVYNPATGQATIQKQ